MEKLNNFSKKVERKDPEIQEKQEGITPEVQKLMDNTERMSQEIELIGKKLKPVEEINPNENTIAHEEKPEEAKQEEYVPLIREKKKRTFNVKEKGTNDFSPVDNTHSESLRYKIHKKYQEIIREKEMKKGTKKLLGDIYNKNIEDNVNQKTLSPEKIELTIEKLKEKDKERLDLLENGPLSTRIKGGVLKGLDKWEKFGQNEEGAKGFAKRMTKNAINLALIGLISSASVEKLAEAGVGTASALGGGVFSYVGRKMAVGLGMGAAFDRVGNKLATSDNKTMRAMQKAMPWIVGVGSVTAATLMSGGWVGVAAGAGMLTSKLVKGKFTKEKIEGREKGAKEKLLEKIKNEGQTINENRVKEIEKEYEKIIKKYENQKIWGKLVDGATKLSIGTIVSSVTLEASGFTHDITHHSQSTTEGEKETEQQNNNITETKPIAISKTENIIQHTNVEAVADHGQGAISMIRELQHNLKAEYGSNLENAPESIQHIIETDADKLSQEFGMYKPGQDAESAMMISGSSLTMDGQGNLIYHDHETGNNIALMEGSDSKIDHLYESKMSDTDHSGIEHENNINEQKVPEQADFFREEPIDISDKPIYSINLDQKPEPVESDTEGIKDDKNFDNSNQDIRQEKNTTGNENTEIEKSVVLSEENIHHVHLIYEKNVNHLFPENDFNHEWDNVKDKIPGTLFRIEDEGSLNDTYKPLVSYLHKLQEVTGVKPRESTLLDPIPETNEEYIERALQKAQEMGKIDRVKL